MIQSISVFKNLYIIYSQNINEVKIQNENITARWSYVWFETYNSLVPEESHILGENLSLENIFCISLI